MLNSSEMTTERGRESQRERQVNNVELSERERGKREKRERQVKNVELSEMTAERGRGRKRERERERERKRERERYIYIIYNDNQVIYSGFGNDELDNGDYCN